MTKKRVNPQTSRYDAAKAEKQLKCWSRWVDARSLCRQMQNRGIDTIEIQEFLLNKHYTLTIEGFNQIKGYYEKV